MSELDYDYRFKVHATREYAEAEVDAMQADLNKSLAVFLPQVIISETFVKTNIPQTQSK